MQDPFEEKVSKRRRKTGRRFLVLRIGYLLFFILGLILVYVLTPQRVIDAVKDTYLNFDADNELKVE